MALQGSGSSRDVPQAIRMVSRTQTQGTMSSNHILAGYTTIDNAQIQPPTVSLAMVPGLVQAPPTIASSQGHNVTPAAVPTTSGATVGMQPLGHVILRSPKEELGQREQERRIRREIANSNERRRMQSINAGFKSLKSILPHTDGEKLSKAAILQQTSEYITQLESDKLKLMHQNEKLRRAFADCKCNSSKHRALADVFEKDEGIGSPAEEDFEDVRRGLIEVRQLLDKERRLRIMYEEQVRTLESQLYPERVQSMKVSSSDERRSSSECSPSVVKPMVAMPAPKIQTCARPLLPPLAPLFSKAEKSDVGLPSLANTVPIVSAQAQTSNAVQKIPEIKEESSETKLVSSSAPTQNEQLVTVFSHSSKSNQPLKKRAIEIHHQSLSDSGNDSGSQPPKRKVAKISIDQPPDIGTRFFLPPTLPPIPTAASDPPLLVHNLSPTALSSSKPQPKLSVSSNQEIQQSNAPHTVPSIQLPVLDSKNHPLLISPTTASQQVSQVAGPQYLSVHPSVTLPNVPKAILPAATANPAQRVDVFPSSQPLGEDVATVARRTSQDVSMDNTTAASLSPVYLTVNGLPNQGANVAYIQHDGNKVIQLANSPYHQPHFIMAPGSNPGTVVLTPPTPDQLLTEPLKITRPQVLAQQTIFQRGNTGAKIQPVIALQTTVASGVSVTMPVVQQSPPKAAQTLVSYARPPTSQTFLQTSAFPKFQQKIHSPQTVLCYTQPEITLNQLNAVPNLALPKSLHQPGVIPVSASLLQPPTGADSPSYIGPSLQEAGMQTKPIGYINPVTLRCRKSSLSATDSCSTASVSGAEDDEGSSKNPLTDDPDNQSAESVPTIKLSGANPSAPADNSKSPTRCGNVAAYDEIQQEKPQAPQGVDVPDCKTPPPGGSVSVFPTVAGSPPVIRRIDAIQTRRNLETIVQAIDHLEQQERRNSQDRTEVSDDGSH